MIFRVGNGFFKVFLLFMIVAMISLSFIYLYNCLLKSPYLKMEQVKIEGVNKKIKYELKQICGLNSDLSLLALNLNEMQQKMEEHPWVRSIILERRFPHTLIIQAQKEIPEALVLMDKFFYMNKWGEIFKEVHNSENMDFPIITGISENKPDTRKRLDLASQILTILRSEKGLWSLDELSEIHLNMRGGVSLYFNHLEAEIKFAETADAEIIEGLKKVAGHLIRSGRIHQVKHIDLTYRNGAVVSFWKG